MKQKVTVRVQGEKRRSSTEVMCTRYYGVAGRGGDNLECGRGIMPGLGDRSLPYSVPFDFIVVTVTSRTLGPPIAMNVQRSGASVRYPCQKGDLHRLHCGEPSPAGGRPPVELVGVGTNPRSHVKPVMVFNPRPKRVISCVIGGKRTPVSYK